jgi:hypothetical protein
MYVSVEDLNKLTIEEEVKLKIDQLFKDSKLIFLNDYDLKIKDNLIIAYDLSDVQNIKRKTWHKENDKEEFYKFMETQVKHRRKVCLR